MQVLISPSTRSSSSMTLLLAHGAGAPMSSAFMTTFAQLLPERGVSVARFEFAYMAQRRLDGKRRPPPRAEALVEEFLAAVGSLPEDAPLAIGGKSMGGRVASLAAQELFQRGRIRGLVCLGYPFHPPKLTDQPRTAHLCELSCPTLIVQGERDPLGTREEVASYELPPAVTITWLAGCDHDLIMPKRAGRPPAETWATAADAVAEFLERS